MGKLARWGFLLALTLIGGEGVSNAGANSVTVVGTEIPGVFHSTEPGVYNQIFDALLEGYPANVAFVPVPTKRAVRQFLAKEQDCFFVGSIELSDLTGANTLWHSESFNLLIGNLYALKGDVLPIDLASLAGKQVATTLPIKDALEGQVRAVVSGDLIPVESSIRALELLEARRVHFAMVFGQDVRVAKGEAYLQQFQKGVEVGRFRESLSCWRNENSRALIEHVSNRTKALKKEGFFNRVFRLTEEH